MGLFSWLGNIFRPRPTPTPPIPVPPPPNPAPTSSLLNLHNNYRARYGKSPLEENVALGAQASAWATQMSKTKVLSHSGFSKRLQNAGFLSGAENVAMGQASIQEVFDSWVDSNGHRANILGDYEYVGFGLATDNNGRPWWCGLFGGR